MVKILAAALLPLLTITSLTGSAECYSLLPGGSVAIQKKLRDMTASDYQSKYGITLKEKTVRSQGTSLPCSD